MNAIQPALNPAPVPGEQFVDLPARLRAVAASQPDAPALIDGETCLTAAGLVGAMDRIAGWLHGRGIVQGDVVASLAAPSADHVALYLGVLAAGAAMAPLPTSAHPDALARMAANSDAAMIFADAAHQAGAAALAGGEKAALDGLITATAALEPLPGPPMSPDDLFDIIYSSGTTGAPKGIEHDALFRERQVARLGRIGCGPGAVSLISTPLYSNTTLVALLPALALGSAVVLMRKFDEAAWLALAERHRATHTMLVPVQYRRLLDHPDFDRTDLSAFAVKLSTSAPMPAALSAEVLRRWPGRLINIYGMTEGGVSAMLDATARPDKLHSVGKPAANAELRIIDAEGGELAPGETGEVVGRAPTLMRGYRGDPERTAEMLWTSPDGLTFLRSGDMGRLDDEGFLTLLDRQKDMIISGGFNIFAADLEAVLADHPDIADVAVIGVPSARWGETPLACVTLRRDAPGDPVALRAWANARLGRHQRLAAVQVLDALPRSSIGKVLKRDLRMQIKQPIVE